MARWAALALSGLLVLGGMYLGALRLTGNFHTVVPGQLYRSGQPSAAEIANYNKEFGIKTIINLRGSDRGSGWYDAEVAEANRLGMAHLDFPMSARRELTAPEVNRLIALMRAARKPILIHCQAGSDRTGLAAALYLVAIANTSERVAEEQLSIRFGHVSLPISPEYAMDRTFEALSPLLRSSHHQ
ncbi:MAG TPA: dual specificity protein phosphatase family protein [Rhizomicrobium sp.]|nr:dual specificity protein phosphatase family protein [Rhizomicrobium sp.]